MNINFFFEDIEKFDFIKDKYKKWIVNSIKTFKKTPGNINFIFCSDTYLLEINKEFLKHDYYTDIITFDYCVGDIISGDIYISTDRVKENSNDLNIAFRHELHRVIIHGILHLHGLQDGTDIEKTKMRIAEDRCLKNL